MIKVFAILALAASLSTSAVVAQERADEAGAERTVSAGALSKAVDGAAYGPFRVLDATRAALVDATDGASITAFEAMLRDNPGIGVIEMIECPGTDDDNANLRLGRLIRAKGIATHVPAGGSVRSGAVELFLAGRRREVDDGAEFAVHAWRDSEGREPSDYAADSPYNQAYVDYYREMGLAHPQAFYDMTNAVANADAHWLTAQDMRYWLGENTEGDVTVGTAQVGAPDTPSIVYLDGYLDSGPGFP